jgi:hypothetical protein
LGTGKLIDFEADWSNGSCVDEGDEEDVAAVEVDGRRMPREDMA